MKAARRGFVKSIPILCSYLFVGMAYGITMQNAGFAWYDAAIVSILVYTGAFQFVLISLLSSGASLITIAVTAFLMNSRQSFYALTFLEEFQSFKKHRGFLIRTMTDETYAVNCTIEKEEKDRAGVMFFVALFSKTSWVLAAALGGLLGELLPAQLNGIDFCMTALFVTIFIDQWEKTNNHKPALTGLLMAVLCLLIVGPDYFLLPALLLASAVLMFEKGAKENHEF